MNSGFESGFKKSIIQISNIMKTSFSLKLCAVQAIFFSSFFNSFSQTKLVISGGAKLNLDTAVYLSTNDLTITNGTLNVPQAYLKVAGTINSNSGIVATDGTVEMNGRYSSVQEVSANAFSTNLVKNVIMNTAGQVSVLGTLGLTDVLTLNAGNLAGGGFFALKSTISKTARVAPVSPSATVSSSEVVVERYIPAKRAYRFLTAPVNTPGDIHANWQENSNNTNPYININPNPGYGTHITGQGSSVNGFDATNTNNPSMFTYNNATQAWVRVPNTFGQMHVGEPYRLLVRGDRNTDLGTNTPPPSITTVRASGSLATGTFIFAKPGGGGTSNITELSSSGTGYSFVGNPYASALDWALVERNDISSTMYIFDPTLSGTNGRGAYIAYNAITGNNNLSSPIDNFIQSGQAFFIRNTGTNPLLTIRETHKGEAFRSVFRTNNTIPRMSLQLLLPGQDSTGQSADAVSVYFDPNFDNALGDEDSYKYNNPDENLSILRYDSLLCIEGRKPIILSDTVPLKIWQMAPKNYFFKSVFANFETTLIPYLEDRYLQTVNILDNTGTTLVPFTVTADSLSYAANRFRVVFRASGTLPLTYTSIDANEKQKGVQVNWSVASEKNIDSYEVERSYNAQQFAKIGQVKAKNNQLSQYGWFDEKPYNGDNYYRIKSVSNSGLAKYSSVVKVRVNNKDDVISITANAVSNNTINIVPKNVPNGTFATTIVNSAGQKIYAGNVTYTNNNNTILNLKTPLAAAIYHLQVLIQGKSYNAAILVK